MSNKWEALGLSASITKINSWINKERQTNRKEERKKKGRKIQDSNRHFI